MTNGTLKRAKLELMKKISNYYLLFSMAVAVLFFSRSFSESLGERTLAYWKILRSAILFAQRRLETTMLSP